METMHSRHIIHRDVKPANFVLGPGRGCHKVYCIDFGLSTRYRHPRTLQHIPYRDGRSLTGTPRYASINNHLGLEQSRRDDLESVGYVLVYFLKGSLPWQGLKARNAKRKYNMILERKQAISIQQLCQFAEYLAYCRSLKFDAKPNVPYLQGLLRELYKAQGHATAGSMEWDWSKFDSLPGSSKCETSCGGGVATTAAAGDSGGTDAAAGNVLGLVASTAAEGITSRTQAATADGKSQLQHPNLNEFPAFDGGGSGATCSRKVAGADVNRGTCPDDANDRQSGELDGALNTGGIPVADCRNGNSVGNTLKPGTQGEHDVQGGSGWSKWNLRPKTSAAFWAGATRGWSARDVSSSQSRTVPVAGMRAATTKTIRGSPISLDRPTASDDTGTEGNVQISNRRWSGTSAHPASGETANKAVRPHTAHGARTADPSGEGLSSHGAARDEAAPVVAGARGMMRYRHERGGSTTSGRIGNGGFHSWFGGGSGGNGARGSAKGTPGGQRTATGSAREPVHQRGRQPTGGSGGPDRAANASSFRTDGAKKVATRRPTSGNGVVGITARASRSSYTVHGRGGTPFGGDMTSTSMGAGRHRPLSARSRGLGMPSRAFVHPTSSGAFTAMRASRMAAYTNMTQEIYQQRVNALKARGRDYAMDAVGGDRGRYRGREEVGVDRSGWGRGWVGRSERGRSEVSRRESERREVSCDRSRDDRRGRGGGRDNLSFGDSLSVGYRSGPEQSPRRKRAAEDAEEQPARRSRLAMNPAAAGEPKDELADLRLVCTRREVLTKQKEEVTCADWLRLIVREQALNGGSRELAEAAFEAISRQPNEVWAASAALVVKLLLQARTGYLQGNNMCYKRVFSGEFTRPNCRYHHDTVPPAFFTKVSKERRTDGAPPRQVVASLSEASYEFAVEMGLVRPDDLGSHDVDYERLAAPPAKPQMPSYHDIAWEDDSTLEWKVRPVSDKRFNVKGFTSRVVEAAPVGPVPQDRQLAMIVPTDRELCPKLHRWALRLMEYGIVIVWKSGVEHVLPDTLSRLPHSTEPQHDTDDSFPDDATSGAPSDYVGPRGPTLEGVPLADVETFSPDEPDVVMVTNDVDEPMITSLRALPFASCASQESQPTGPRRSGSSSAPPVRLRPPGEPPLPLPDLPVSATRQPYSPTEVDTVVTAPPPAQVAEDDDVEQVFDAGGDVLPSSSGQAISSSALPAFEAARKPLSDPAALASCQQDDAKLAQVCRDLSRDESRAGGGRLQGYS
eukprot:g13425.t1